MSEKINKTKSVKLYYRTDNPAAEKWEKKIKKWLKVRHPEIKTVDNNPQVVIALGGDGTILEAAKKCVPSKALLVGLNLGQAGFLASARNPKDFLNALDKIFKGDYTISERMMLEVEVVRKNKTVFKSAALNEVLAINPLGMVEIDVFISDYHLQKIQGTGVLVSTPTGSTAFNLSAHGPVMMPDTKGMIVTELFDHNIPAPSMILNGNNKVILKISNFRKKNLLSIAKSGRTADTLLSVDGEAIFPLAAEDNIKIKQSQHIARFCELEKNYFLKSFKEKFDFK